MQPDGDRILTTHVGSLPRPLDVFTLLEQNESTGATPDGYRERISVAVNDIVQQQIDCGVDVVGDGEVSKFSYTFYVRHRLGGIGVDEPAKTHRPKSVIHRDLAEHPDFRSRLAAKNKGISWYDMVPPPACIGPVHYACEDALATDLENLRAAVDELSPSGAFVNAASPGVLTKFVPDHYYNDEDAYIEALSNAMKVEYEAIYNAGFVVQIDAPDLASARHNQYQDLTDREFVKIAARNIEALNSATANIPPEAMRMHVCWGNYEGPHTHDIPFAEIADVVFSARPAAILFEGANPRHAHEWEDLAGMRIPQDKILIPGVIDTTSNFVEHPRLVAQRICQYADIVGRERIIAGTDCGFATFAGPDNPIVPSVVWAKLRALSEGAALATDRLW